MVFFNSYVKLPEGKPGFKLSTFWQIPIGSFSPWSMLATNLAYSYTERIIKHDMLYIDIRSSSKNTPNDHYDGGNSPAESLKTF